MRTSARTAEGITPDVNPDSFEDGRLIKVEETAERVLYKKFVSVEENRYEIDFVYWPDHREFEFHFGIAGQDLAPITNAGLKTFGHLADTMAQTYEDILKERKIDSILIYASGDSALESDIKMVGHIIETHPGRLDKLILQSGAIRVEFGTREATIKRKNSFGISIPKRIPISASVMDDIKYITNVDMSVFIPQILAYIGNPDSLMNDKKRVQRLKLFKFYLEKRYPQFTFNSRETFENGKRKIEFEVDQNGTPYLLAFTHNNER